MEKKGYGADQHDLIDDFLLSILKPATQGNSIITLEDLERAERNQIPLCDEANIEIFRFWWSMGGIRRPLTPVEAAETPGPLAKDFIYLIKRMRELADSETTFAEFSNRHLYQSSSNIDDLYRKPTTDWES